MSFSVPSLVFECIVLGTVELQLDADLIAYLWISIYASQMWFLHVGQWVMQNVTSSAPINMTLFTLAFAKEDGKEIGNPFLVSEGNYRLNPTMKSNWAIALAICKRNIINSKKLKYNWFLQDGGKGWGDMIHARLCGTYRRFYEWFSSINETY